MKNELTPSFFFGNIVYETNRAGGDRYGYTGREFEVLTGLQYNRARYYDPETGRWTTQDPDGINAGDPNLYRYASNNVLTTIDPNGLFGDQPSREGIGSFFEGAIVGGFSENDSWSATGGQIVAGIIPGVGQVADARDTIADARDVWNGKEGSTLNMIGAIAGWVPLFGDGAKSFIKGGKKIASEVGQEAAQKATKEAAEKAAKNAPVREPITVRESLDIQDARKALDDPIHDAYTRPLDAAKIAPKSALIAADEIASQGALQGKSAAEIQSQLSGQGYSSVTGNNGGTIYTKALPDGNTAVVRVDPAMVKPNPKGFADEVPHIHKEIVPSNKVTNGNYNPSDSIKLDDNGLPTLDKRAAHIPGGH